MQEGKQIFSEETVSFLGGHRLIHTARFLGGHQIVKPRVFLRESSLGQIRFI